MRILIQFEKKPLLFQKPRSVISCHQPSLLKNSLAEMESYLKAGFYLAGFFSYEAGYCFEKKLLDNQDYAFPLVFFGVYDRPLNSKLKSKNNFRDSDLRDMRLSVSRKRYFADIATIRDYIRKGDVYQITYCLKLKFRYLNEPFSLFWRLFQEQPVPYSAYLETPEYHILSLSPELFIKKRFNSIVTKPMKGTWPRENRFWKDVVSRMRFQYDVKNRAENVMIADLLRNDLGRIAQRVRAPRLFEVTRYRTLFQMTSTVTANISSTIDIWSLFASLFPSGSVTGAPKIRAMQIIKELETEKRNIYTGAIGYISPQRDFFFNIPIRTVLLRNGEGEMGIGGGIVWDSTPEGEWQEGLLKAKFISELCSKPLAWE